MSTGCPGGAHGVPPVSWTGLQSHASKSVNALNEAKLALAGGRTSDAAQQISSAEGELEAFVAGLRMSCSGGPSGRIPPALTCIGRLGRR